MSFRTVLQLFEKTAVRLPDKCAVTEPDGEMSYGELRRKARAIGRALEERLKDRPGQPVLLFEEKSGLCLASMLGILYSGHPYVPSDVKTPPERLASILKTLGMPPVLTSCRDEASLAAAGYTGRYLLSEALEEEGARLPETMTEQKMASLMDTELAYVLFTSGSTGTPKGVAVRHRSLLDYVENAGPAVGIREEDVVGNQTPFYADMSLKDIYMTLTAGAELCLIPQKYFMTPKKLLTYLSEKKVSFLAWVPTAYRLVSQFDALSKVKPESLRRFVFSGESMPLPVFRYWKKHYPGAGFLQLYGPTEITGACSRFEVTRDYADGETIPIGKAFPNTGLLLLAEDGSVIPETCPDVPGEICIFGSCLAAGYYGEPENTAAAFVQNPLSIGFEDKMYKSGDLARYDGEGNLVFLSRKDYQIKHGGRRIELGEIEAAAQSLPAVAAACAVHRREKDEIVLYFSGDITGKELQPLLAEKLPRYMMPGSLLRMEALPQLPNGKLDRKRLDRLANEGEEHA